MNSFMWPRPLSFKKPGILYVSVCIVHVHMYMYIHLLFGIHRKGGKLRRLKVKEKSMYCIVSYARKVFY